MSLTTSAVVYVSSALLPGNLTINILVYVYTVHVLIQL